MTSPPPPPLLRHLTAIDSAISLALYNLTQPIIPRPILETLEHSGDGRLFFPIIIAVLLSPLPDTSPHLRVILLNLLIGALLDLIFIGLTKHLVKRPRPVYNKNMSLSFAVDHWSFPSGHASRVCFIATLITFYSSLIGEMLGESGKMFVVVWAGLTSVSRVLLGRHYVFDVVVGAGIGVGNACFVFRYFNSELLESVLVKLLS